MGLGQRRGSGMAMVDDHALDVDLDSSITGGIRGTKMRVIPRRCIGRWLKAVLWCWVCVGAVASRQIGHGR